MHELEFERSLQLCIRILVGAQSSEVAEVLCELRSELHLDR